MDTHGVSGFRGLLRYLNAQLEEDRTNSFLHLTLTFNTLDSYTNHRIRFSLTRVYANELPYAWCVADLCEYAMQHELQEAVPALFTEPDHRPGELDQTEVALDHAAKSRVRYENDIATGRWDGGKMRELKQVW